ncbi:hypothetical protein ABB37_06095 [Leptomonas pyrrhocoris]|uniref:Uncharacterized protein n=1 Tax=Leptomonas pyrrhocoris TaxID=157538 RepID=A0A0N0VEQ6_LEPPY|nr:hypothetical protein ABB37_06095 [Leptomonas pyrrhocoris]KPA78474.1 hypothetical protein ABB37_06095 [Leptomonas pyrrhocoris]|eukprot:XP_015656913.1 hypothetical protein ABB37_06095 [Leptomonas pyrrhocoris]
MEMFAISSGPITPAFFYPQRYRGDSDFHPPSPVPRRQHLPSPRQRRHSNASFSTNATAAEPALSQRSGPCCRPDTHHRTHRCTAAATPSRRHRRPRADTAARGTV